MTLQYLIIPFQAVPVLVKLGQAVLTHLGNPELTERDSGTRDLNGVAEIRTDPVHSVSLGDPPSDNVPGHGFRPYRA